MKAVLTVLRKDGDNTTEESLMFDTDKSKKICDVKNQFNYAVQEMYLSPGGIIFVKNTKPESLEMIDQRQARKYIGENYPETYIEFFGEVKEA